MNKFYQKNMRDIHLVKRKNGGFTLIELLVVVLIIGILSAVVLPQYTKAVEKSRSAEAMVILNYLKKQGDLYILANGIPSQAVSFADLEAELPSGFQVMPDQEDMACDNKHWCYMTHSEVWGDVATTYPDSPMARRYKNGNDGSELLYSLEYISNQINDSRKGKIICTDDSANYCSMFGTTSGNVIN